MHKRQRLDTMSAPHEQQLPHPLPPVSNDAFIADVEAQDSGADDDDDDDKPKNDKKAGRRKIKIEFIQDKSRRHITFSKRKAGIMKKAYELSTLTGTQVLLLVVSETGLVYTFTTAKLQPLVTQPEGKNLIQACLNAPQGSLPMPTGPPIARSTGPMPPPPTVPPGSLPPGMSMAGQPGGAQDGDDDDDDSDERPGQKRRRRGSNAQQPPRGTNGSPSVAQASVPPGPQNAAPQTPMSSISSPTSPNQIPPGGYRFGGVPPHTEGYPTHNPMMQPGAYQYSPTSPMAAGAPQSSLSAAAAAQQQGHWPQQQQQYASR